VITVAYGVVDEKKWFACPECNRPLFSGERATVYDIEREVKHGRPEAKSTGNN
jgi:hypothetical protein